MTLQYDQARDEIFAVFNTAWQANAAAQAGYIPEVRWQGVQYREIPDGSKFWCRISKDNVFEEQTSLSTCVGTPGQRRYTASGLAIVQLFCPKSNTESFAIGQKLAKVAQDAFRGRSTGNGMWFRNVRIKELDPEETCFRFNVVAEFEYDDIGIAGGASPIDPPTPPAISEMSYEHVQSTASAEWIINHNLGYRPAVTALNAGGVEMIGELIHINVNQARIYFDQPLTGMAVCS